MHFRQEMLISGLCPWCSDTNANFLSEVSSPEKGESFNFMYYVILQTCLGQGSYTMKFPLAGGTADLPQGMLQEQS